MRARPACASLSVPNPRSHSPLLYSTPVLQELLSDEWQLAMQECAKTLVEDVENDELRNARWLVKWAEA